jgi:putative copper export protein
VTEGYGLLDATYAAARWGWYLAAFLVLGAGSYAPFLFRSRTGLQATDPDLARALTQRAAGIGVRAGLALLFLAAIRLYLQSRTLLDSDEPISAEFLRAVLGSGWGHGWLRQAAMGVLATLAFASAVRGSRFGWMVASAASGGLGFTLGMTGHAVTERAGPGGALLDAAHVWAGGLWLGGLAVMMVAGVGACRGLPSERRAPLLRAVVADFSRRALLLAPLTIALGVWLAARYLGWSWPLHLLESSYGVSLGVKLAALIGVALLGAYNWRVTQPALARPGEGGESRLRRSGWLEILFGILVLAATAVLVALPIPGEM